MTKRPHDPWAHRRGEPRVFALGWSLYLLAAVTGAIVWIVQGQTTASAAGPAARIVLVVVLVGITIIWPMVRLSQASPRHVRPARSASASAMLDMLIIFVPAQVIVWPLSWVARWPVDIAAGVVSMMGAWALLTGSMIALGTGPFCPRGRLVGLTRTCWMLLWLGVVCTPAVLSGLAHMHDRANTGSTANIVHVDSNGELWSMGSPLTAAHAITGKALSGVAEPLGSPQWSMIVGVALLGVFGWMVAVIAEIVRPVGVEPSGRHAVPLPRKLEVDSGTSTPEGR